MKKATILLTLAVFFAFASSAFAQGKMSVGLGLGYHVPQGDMASKSKGDRDNAIGFSANCGYMVNDNFQAMFGIGSMTYAGKSSGDDVDAALMPVMVSGRYFFSQEKIMPYAGLNVGMTNITISFPGDEASKMILSYGVIAGASYAINEKINMDFGLGYNFVPSKDVKFKFDTIGTQKVTYDAVNLSINFGVNYKF